MFSLFFLYFNEKIYTCIESIFVLNIHVRWTRFNMHLRVGKYWLYYFLGICMVIINTTYYSYLTPLFGLFFMIQLYNDYLVLHLATCTFDWILHENTSFSRSFWLTIEKSAIFSSLYYLVKAHIMKIRKVNYWQITLCLIKKHTVFLVKIN